MASSSLSCVIVNCVPGFAWIAAMVMAIFAALSGFYNPQEGDILFKGHSVKGCPPCRSGAA